MKISCAKVLLFLLVVLAFSPCLLAQTEPVVVAFWHSMGGERGKILDKLVADFNKANPSIRVESVYKGSYNVLNEEILRSIASGTPPVLAQVYENWTAQYIQINAIVPAADYFAGENGLDNEQINDILYVFRQSNTYGGKLWTLPFNKSMYVLYYHKDAFKEAGVKPPSTWDELVEVGSKLKTAKPVMSPFIIDSDNLVDIFTLLLFTEGGSLINKSSGQAGFNGKEGRLALYYMVDLARKHQIGVFSFKKGREDFGKGMGCMYIGTTSSQGYFKKNSRFPYGIAPIPSGKKKVAVFAGTNLAIFKTNPKTQKAAWDFTKWLIQKDRTAYWAIQTGYLPVRQSAINSPAYQKHLQKDPRSQVGINELKFAVAENPPAPPWQIIRGMLGDNIFLAVTGKKLPPESLSETAEIANKLLKR